MNTTQPATPIKPNQQTLFNASAGSGKTFNLVYHFLYRTFLNDQSDNSSVPFRNLIAVTFTIKAAGEMRSRILQTLSSFRFFGLQELPPTDQKMAELLVHQFEMKPDQFRNTSQRILSYMTHFYNMVSVGTIDKFTHGVVRSFAQDLNLNPDFDVEMDTAMILEKSVRQLISQVGQENSKELSETLVQQVLEAVSEGKSWNVEQLLNDEARSLISDVDREYASILSAFEDEKWKAIIVQFKSFTSNYENRAVELGEQLNAIIEKAGLKPSDFSRKIPERLISNLTSRDISTIAKTTIGPQFMEFKEGAFFNKKMTAIAEPLIEPHREEFVETLEKIQDLVSEGNFVKFVQTARRSLNGLRFLGHVEKELEAIRELENTVLISDFNRLIQKNLNNQPEAFIYERIGERYQHYFIDEFQDTSELQWQNLLPLIENALSANGTNMLVGDAKQSIYRFRGAEVSQFIELATEDPAFSITHKGERIERYSREVRQLPMNYRSYRQIVAFNNHLIDQLAHVFESEDWADDHIAAIYRMGRQEAHHREEGYVAVETLEFKEDKTLTDICNAYVLEKVRDALDRGYSCRDITILTRKNKASSEIAVFLSQQDDISVISEDSLNTGNSSDIKLILATIRFQRTPNEGVFQAQWVQRLLETKRVSLEWADAAYSAIRNKDFLNWMSKSSELLPDEKWMALPPIEWIDLLLSHYLIKPDAYVSKFLDEAFSYQRKANEIQMHFVDYATENLSKWNIETSSAVDAITVGTIHKSKGLEYPIVIVPMVGWEMSSIYDRIWVKTEGIKPFGELPFVKTSPSSVKEIDAFQDAYRNWVKNNTMDHSNLMYVAFTRAECELYIGLVSPEYKRLYKNTASEKFGDLIKAFPNFQNKEDLEYSSGQKTVNQESEKDETKTEDFVLETKPVAHWRSRIRIAPKREKSWDENRSDRDMGIIIHRILAETQSLETALNLAEEIRQNGEISSSDFDSISKTLHTVWTNDEIIGVFNPSSQTLNEQAILTPKGENYRPDRIVFNQDHIRVIDFKTGEERSSHYDQIRKYGHLLEEMGYSNVSAELFYLSENKISVKKINLH
jgi:ATP-dependent exoDNAse (exonuclease V) beta subunit